MAYPSNPIYKIAKDDGLLANTSEAEDGVKLTRDGVEFYIPPDSGNRHWQEYLEWVAEGNTAEAADTTLTWDDIRATRDQILRETDWTMTTGATVDQAQWAAYRPVSYTHLTLPTNREV